MNEFDYIVVGSGSAGCVMANKLSEDPATRVLLLEAGPTDRHPYVEIPKGIAKLRLHPTLSWRFPVEPELGRPQGEVWPRGKMIGGTSSLNGMFYIRGQPEDYDAWEKLGNRGWGWKHMAPCFQQMEDHELGADDLRGSGGPLHVSLPYGRNAIEEAMIEAGVQSGLPRKQDLNRADQLGVGYYPLTTWRGRRWSAANAFLHPVYQRRNLTVMTGVMVERVLFEGRRAVGVACRMRGEPSEFRTLGEIILCAGALKSPQILQHSGIGPADTLRAAGVQVIHHSPGVGNNLREHLSMTVIHRLLGVAGENREYRGLRLARNTLRFYLMHSGVLTYSTFSVGGFARTGLEGTRPDVQFFLAPLSWDTTSAKAVVSRVRTAKEPGLTCFAYFLHPESTGSVHIQCPDPDLPAQIRPRWLSCEKDRAAAVAVVRFMRRLLAQPALRPYVGAEITPGAGIQDDADLLSCYARFGSTANHAVGTCSMGITPEAVVDEHLRVRGVEKLRVIDCSVIPLPVSGNTSAPVMALAWRAAALIKAETVPRAAALTAGFTTQALESAENG